MQDASAQHMQDVFVTERHPGQYRLVARRQSRPHPTRPRRSANWPRDGAQHVVLYIRGTSPVPMLGPVDCFVMSMIMSPSYGLKQRVTQWR
jgi:hypothetical protein